MWNDLQMLMPEECLDGGHCYFDYLRILEKVKRAQLKTRTAV